MLEATKITFNNKNPTFAASKYFLFHLPLAVTSLFPEDDKAPPAKRQSAFHKYAYHIFL